MRGGCCLKTFVYEFFSSRRRPDNVLDSIHSAMGFEIKFLQHYRIGNNFDIVLLYVYTEYNFCCFLSEKSTFVELFVSVISACNMDTVFENLKEEPIDEEEVDRKPSSALENSCGEEDQPTRYALFSFNSAFIFLYCSEFCEKFIVCVTKRVMILFSLILHLFLYKSPIKCRILIKIYRVLLQKGQCPFFPLILHLCLNKSLIKC